MVDLSVYTNHRMGDMYYNNNKTVSTVIVQLGAARHLTRPLRCPPVDNTVVLTIVSLKYTVHV
jgi:hypothetical protein